MFKFSSFVDVHGSLPGLPLMGVDIPIYLQRWGSWTPVPSDCSFVPEHLYIPPFL